MDYNTQREKLKLPEYGRNVQIMINYAKTIESREERNKAAETIIAVMGSMNPPLKDSRDYKHKLWDHLHLIANFELDVDAPFELPEREVLSLKPDALPYPNQRIKYLHYGKIAEQMLKKASEMEEGEQKELFIKQIANHMKLSYITWNKDSVPDIVILKAVNDLSAGRVQIPEGTVLAEYKEAPKPQNPPKNKKRGKKMK